MTKNQSAITLDNLLPHDPTALYDADQKVGTIMFSAAEKRELLKLTTSKGWDILKNSYVKQRLVQISVAGLNVAQTADSLFFYKGRAAEANEIIKQVEMVAKELQSEEDDKN